MPSAKRHAASGSAISSAELSSPSLSSPAASGSAGQSQTRGTLKQRKARPAASPPRDKMMDGPDEESVALLDAGRDTATGATDAESTISTSASWTRRNQWIVYALASGACAAFNGVFAKLTTTELTSTFSEGIARFFYLTSIEPIIEFIVRATFFGLNLAFNGVMWTLFTTALARGHSTTQVSIMNTSSNFFITAVLGFAIFSESLPPLWWLGAVLLIAGNVIIGQKDESTAKISPAAEPLVFDDGASAGSSFGSGGVGSHRSGPAVGPVTRPEEKDEEEEAAQEIEAMIDRGGEDVADLGDIDED